MTHKVTIEFEIDATDFDYPNNGMSLVDNLTLDFLNEESLIMTLENTPNYRVKVEEL